MQLDALREVGSIGAGHAATALSQLVDKPIGLTYPQLEIVPIGDVPRVFGGPEQLVGATYLRLLGDISGGILFMTSRDSALALVDLMHSRPAGTTKSFGHDEEALVTHVASILASSYAAAIARLTDMNILPSTPSFVLDMAGAILEVAVTEVGMTAMSALLVRTRFADEETAVDAGLFFLPDPDSLQAVLGRLGLA
jgi:chemotaxis protein CheC